MASRTASTSHTSRSQSTHSVTASAPVAVSVGHGGSFSSPSATARTNRPPAARKPTRAGKAVDTGHLSKATDGNRTPSHEAPAGPPVDRDNPAALVQVDVPHDVPQPP